MFRLQGARFCGLVALLLALCCGLIGCDSPAGPAQVAHANGLPTPVQSVTAALTIATSAGPANPQRLLVPAIGVNAAIEDVGIATNGDLGTPTRAPWVDTGWYKNGPRPGERGSAVIDGHLDKPGGSPAVFWRLRDLRAGNEVDVVRSDGKTLRFRVTDVEYYQPQDAPIQQIFGNTSGKYLNLITCAGDWIPIQHQTTLRLVVYTILM